MSVEKRKKILTALGAIASMGFVYFAYQFFMYVSTDNAQVEAHAVLLSSKVGGFVTDVKVAEGQKVTKGQVLVELDSRDYLNTVKQTRGELLGSEARRKDSERNFARLQQLYRNGAISPQQYDTALANYSDAKAKFEAIEAQVAQAQLNLDNTHIVAPANGFIARRSVEVGQLASPGVPLIGFVSSEERWVTANFKETDIAKIKLGAKVKIAVDAIPGRDYYGTVTAISAATGATFTLLPPDNATGNFTKVVQRVPVKIQFAQLGDEDFNLLRAGLSALVKVSKH